MWVDSNPDPVTGQRGSVYIADGYGNHRVVVFNAAGQYLRQWGGVAGTVINVTSDYPDKFGAGDGGHPHCVVGGTDGLIYVCDRQNDRVQVFTKTGVLQRVIAILPGTGATPSPGGAPPPRYGGLRMGSRFLQRLGADVHVRGRRRQRACADHESHAGFNPRQVRPTRTSGLQFTFLHTVSKDSKGNLYTGETINGRRIQKFKQVECNNGKGKGDGKGNCG